MEGKYDGLLLQIARDHPEGIDQLLGTFFSFLRRKTDFFSRPEAAEQAVLRCLREQAELKQKSMGATKKQKPAKKVSKTAKKQKPKGPSEYEKQQQKLAKKKNKETANDLPAGVCEVDENGNDIVPSTSSDGAATEKLDSKETDEIPEEESKGQTPNRGNGGDGPGYSWQQTLKEVTIVVPVPAGTKSKHLTVDVTSTKNALRSAQLEKRELLLFRKFGYGPRLF